MKAPIMTTGSNRRKKAERQSPFSWPLLWNGTRIVIRQLHKRRIVKDKEREANHPTTSKFFTIIIIAPSIQIRNSFYCASSSSSWACCACSCLIIIATSIQIPDFFYSFASSFSPGGGCCCSCTNGCGCWVSSDVTSKGVSFIGWICCASGPYILIVHAACCWDDERASRYGDTKAPIVKIMRSRKKAKLQKLL